MKGLDMKILDLQTSGCESICLNTGEFSFAFKKFHSVREIAEGLHKKTNLLQ